MTALVAANTPVAMVGETRNAAVDFEQRLDTSEVLTGTPTVSELTTSDLTIDNVKINTAALTVNGNAVGVGGAIQFRFSGQQQSLTYTLLVQSATDSSPAQTLRAKVRFKAIPDTA